MLTITTYLVKPFVLFNTRVEAPGNNPSIWLRKRINELMNARKRELKKDQIPTHIFHNHDEETGGLISDYPLIQFHYINKNFYVSGINQGGEALQKLIEAYNKENIKINRDIYLEFTWVPELSCKTKITAGAQLHQYTLYNWLPFCNTNYHEYKALKTLDKKISFLEARLKVNIIDDFGKHLGLKLGKATVKIMDVDSFKRPWIAIIDDKKHEHLYHPFTLQFESNLKMPGMITLGNRKAYGFGRIIPTI